MTCHAIKLFRFLPLPLPLPPSPTATNPPYKCTAVCYVRSNSDFLFSVRSINLSSRHKDTLNTSSVFDVSVFYLLFIFYPCLVVYPVTPSLISPPSYEYLCLSLSVSGLPALYKFLHQPQTDRQLGEYRNKETNRRILFFFNFYSTGLALTRTERTNWIYSLSLSLSL